MGTVAHQQKDVCVREIYPAADNKRPIIREQCGKVEQAVVDAKLLHQWIRGKAVGKMTGLCPIVK